MKRMVQLVMSNWNIAGSVCNLCADYNIRLLTPPSQQQSPPPPPPRFLVAFVMDNTFRTPQFQCSLIGMPRVLHFEDIAHRMMVIATTLLPSLITLRLLRPSAKDLAKVVFDQNTNVLEPYKREFAAKVGRHLFSHILLEHSAPGEYFPEPQTLQEWCHCQPIFSGPLLTVTQNLQITQDGWNSLFACTSVRAIIIASPECAVCFQPVVAGHPDTITLACGHVGHFSNTENCSGLLQWFRDNSTCPFCRHHLEQFSQSIRQSPGHIGCKY
jgi:hypothetical protein